MQGFLKKKIIFVIGTFALIAVTGAFAIESLFLTVMDKIHPTPNDEVEEHAISFVKEYPFENETAPRSKEEPDQKQTAPTLPGPLSFLSKLDESVESIAFQSSRLAPFYQNVFGFSQRVFGRTLIEDEEKDVFRLKNGKLVFLEKWETDEEANRSLTDFSEWLKERDTDLLFIFPLSIADDECIEFPGGMETGYCRYQQALADHLTDNDIAFIDTKPNLLSIDGDFFHWVYRTDHHWNVRAGILTAGQVVQTMRDTFGYPVDPSVCDVSRYRSVIYPSAFLGTLGKKVTRGYSAPEDIEVLYPTFDTCFHIEIPSMDIDQTGSFEDALINKSVLNPHSNAYGAFMYHDRPLIRVHNESCTNGIRVLMLKYSKAEVVTPYLACAVEYLDIIDPRFFDGSIRTFVTKTNPDIVMICSAELFLTD